MLGLSESGLNSSVIPGGVVTYIVLPESVATFCINFKQHLHIVRLTPIATSSF